MQKIAVVGASGYTGVELVRILSGHPDVALSCVTSRQHAGKNVADVFPSLAGRIDLVFDANDVDQVCAKADIVLTALPHQTAMEVVPSFIAAGKRVIDLSADYRLKDAELYEKWYQKHTSKDLLAVAVYGLPELNRKAIAEAELVANPGCYPTSAALALMPLLNENLVDPDSIVIDSKSGTSGAGRSARESSLFCEVNEAFRAYGVAAHRHTPEIEQTFSGLVGRQVVVSFTPHLLPVNRGILSTCYARMLRPMTTSEAIALFKKQYANAPFVRVKDEGVLPDIAFVRGSNYCDLGIVCDERTGRIVVVSVIDNLVKGASGQAVQNMNLMLGLSETSGLQIIPAFP
ncbi:MAG: N-acetyl-gamma-glutamyl-phosphate reductase [Desulfuromonas sp.]|nr:MAG: N-acetyl-gamma-glutamyl-phosphate reductase [Desulfuromonas sp.]